MNILILNWRGPGHPHEGGAEIVTIEHAKGWIKAGHKVTWFTSMYDGAKAEQKYNNIKIIRRGNEVFGVQLQAFVWYLFGKHEKFDVVIDQFHGIPFFTPLYVRTKKVAFIHEVAKNVWALNPWPWPLNILPRIIGGNIEPLIFRYIYKNTPFITVSNSTRRDLEDWGIKKKNIVVIINGFEGAKKVYTKSKTPKLMFLGALARDKGVEDALKAAQIVLKKIPRCELYVVGKGDPNYTNFLKKLAVQLNIRSSVKFLGFVNNIEKYKLLGKSWILVNPSVREGWGLVNIEANSQKTPVIGYHVPGIVDSVMDGKTGLLVECGDYQDLAKKCIILIQKRYLYNKISRQALKWSKNFSWQNSVKKSLSLIEDL